MQTTHRISTRLAATGYVTSIVSFVIMALFLVDVFNVIPSQAGSTTLAYNSGTKYLFPIGYWYEVAISLIALVAGIVLAFSAFYERRGG
jgi:hypothetical protein